jgi:hypothetical protein
VRKIRSITGSVVAQLQTIGPARRKLMGRARFGPGILRIVRLDSALAEVRILGMQGERRI